MIIDRGMEVVVTKIKVLVEVMDGAKPVGVIVDVIVKVAGEAVTENGAIATAAKSIQEVLEKNVAI